LNHGLPLTAMASRLARVAALRTPLRRGG